MLRRIRNFINGRRVITVPEENLCGVFDIIYRNGLSFFGERRTKDGNLRMEMDEKNARILKNLLSARDISVEFSPPHGLPVVLAFAKQRPVIPVGLLLMLACFFVSERTVWDVRITGNTKTPEETIVRQLEELGFGVGTYYPSVNFNQLHADYLASQSEIAWLSVYMNGSVAEVEVRELYHGKTEMHEAHTYANVVAARSGVVKQVNVYEGEAAVKCGDIVKQGQVVISGAVNMKEENAVRYEYAAGEVICTVAEPFSVSASLKTEEKQLVNTKKKVKSIKIFKKTLNLFGNGGNEAPTCVKIETVDRLSVFGVFSLPVFVTTEEICEYETVTALRTPEEVAAEVSAEVARQMKRYSEMGEITERQIDTKLENGVYTVSGVVYLDCDIGTTVEFTAEE